MILFWMAVGLILYGMFKHNMVWMFIRAVLFCALIIWLLVYSFNFPHNVLLH